MDPRTAPPLLERTVPAPRSGTRTRAPKAPRPVPVRDDAYAHLDLGALRECRAALQAEENKVSYWRRILQARLDTVRAGNGTVSTHDEHLAPVLADSTVRAGRTALVQVLQVDDIPPLPSLAELWDRRVPPSDVAGNLALEADLTEAESQLSAYRTALHARLESATGELIARYREKPTLCLIALPLPPHRSAVGH